MTVVLDEQDIKFLEAGLKKTPLEFSLPLWNFLLQKVSDASKAEQQKASVNKPSSVYYGENTGSTAGVTNTIPTGTATVNRDVLRAIKADE